MRLLPVLPAALTGLALLAPTVADAGAPTPDPARATLVGWSMLPTETYVPNSAPSGFWTSGGPTVPAPYAGQPVQGFSGTHALGDGSFLVMSDNNLPAAGGRGADVADVNEYLEIELSAPLKVSAGLLP